MKIKKVFSSFVIATMISTLAATTVLAAGGTPPSGGPGGTPPDGNGGQGGSSSSNVSHTGVTTFKSDTTEDGKTYSSTESGKNAILVTGGTSTISNATVTKSGDSSDENSDFYGTNAGIIATDGILNISNSKITTNGGHANAAFAYSNGKINISDSTINTTNNNSGGIMVTGGGTLTANNVTATTEGNSSAAIRSDRGGGTLVVNNGTYTSNGVGSPAIYSTADITVNNATLVSTKSEGAIVEGKNSITLNNTKLTDSNTTLNGQSTTYKNIFLYQSMSGDADTGTAKFTSKDSTITTNNGDVMYVTNTTADINLENTTFVTKSDGAFLRVEAAKWGTSGSNGGNVTLNATKQDITGDIIADDISTITISLANGSNYKGTINGEKTAKSIALTLDASSTLTLTGDTYVTSLTDATTDYSNINLNGHTLYVNGKAITSTQYKGASENTTSNTTTQSSEENVTNTEDNTTASKSLPQTGIGYAFIVVGIIAIIGVVFFLKKERKYNGIK